MAKDCGTGIAEIGVDELSWNDFVTVEGLSWRVSGFVFGPGAWEGGIRTIGEMGV